MYRSIWMSLSVSPCLSVCLSVDVVVSLLLSMSMCVSLMVRVGKVGFACYCFLLLYLLLRFLSSKQYVSVYA